MRAKLATIVALGAIATWLVVPAGARTGTLTVAQGQASRTRGAGMTDWPLHNLDLSSTRYSPLDAINTSNAGRLAVTWSFDAGTNLGEVTPLVVNGVMYFNAGSKLFAVNAATGAAMWTTEVDPTFTASGRGPAYGDGKIYAYGHTSMFAVDAKTGKPVYSFGREAILPLVNNALEFAYPGKYPATVDPVSLGYFSLTSPPTYYRGTFYVGLPHGDSLIPGGLMVAVDGTTGAIKWTFNPVPQEPKDDGWAIAKDTWGGGVRTGAGVWTQAAIDPDLGMLYFNASNPAPDFDGSKRIGKNLFTNSVIALHLATGKLAWYYQTLHHDIWDMDVISGPVLFDITVGGRVVKAIGVTGKTCYVYVFNRETGEPINPMVETSVPTFTDVPGEQVWPTQPIPHTSRGTPQQPFCATYPTVTDPELAKRVRPFLHPYLSKELIIMAPSIYGGANHGPPSFSPRTGLMYVTGRNEASSIKVKPVGDTLRPGVPAVGFFGNIAAQGDIGMVPTATVAAYDPATGLQAWYTELPRTTTAGNLATAGDLVFQGVGVDFYGLDARSGKQVFKSTLKSGTRASAMTYEVNGRQYLSIVATNTVVTFGLPAEAVK